MELHPIRVMILRLSEAGKCSLLRMVLLYPCEMKIGAGIVAARKYGA